MREVKTIASSSTIKPNSDIVLLLALNTFRKQCVTIVYKLEMF